MAKFDTAIRAQHRAFIEAQQIFFVASAPLGENGHVNLSPKGGDVFRVLDENRIAYLDYTGSGNETSAHLLENGRITIMFCAFQGPPNILRLYGKGRTVLPGDPEWNGLSTLFILPAGTRQIIVADVHQVQTSCGYSVPLYQHTGERDYMQKWTAAKGAEGLVKYREEKNRQSIDGLPTAIAAQQNTNEHEPRF